MTAMAIVADSQPFVVSVDTHSRKYVDALIDSSSSAWFDTQSFPISNSRINRAINRRTDGKADKLGVVEGAATCGVILAGTVAAHGSPSLKRDA